MAKKILCLSTLDERAKGHAYAMAQEFKENGYQVQFISLLRTKSDTQFFIIDTLNKYNLKYLAYKLITLLCQVLFLPYPNMRGWYKGIDFATAKDIIKLLQFTPDYIYIGSYQWFLSPKEINRLAKMTHAKIIISMVDEKLLGGGCAYPVLGCKNYETGCINCPEYKYASFIPRYIWNQKKKYFSDLPLIIRGVNYDLQKLLKIKHFANKKTMQSVGVPVIPFNMSKDQAREILNIPKDEFIIMSGAVSPKDPKKGFSELIQALNIFASKIQDKKVTFLGLGNNVNTSLLNSKINVITPGYLDLKGLFTAFYACDVYISPSLEDSGPYMVNYSIACGRPVIAFPVGIALDLVVKKKTGYLAEYRDPLSMADGIYSFYSLDDNKLDEYGTKCLEHIMSFKSLSNWYKNINS